MYTYIYIYICIPVVRGYVLYWYRLGNSASSNWEHHLVGISFPAMKSHICTTGKMTCRSFLKTHGSLFQAVPAPCNSNLAYYYFQPVSRNCETAGEDLICHGESPPGQTLSVPLQLWSSLDQTPA